MTTRTEVTRTVEVEPPLQTRRRPRLTGLLITLLIGGLMGEAVLVGFLVSRAGVKRPPLQILQPTDGCSLFECDSRPSARLAVSIALGLQREQDGLTFGEFVRLRMDRVCGWDTRGAQSTHASENGPTASGAYLWIVMTFASGSRCKGLGNTNLVWIAAVWSDTGEVIPLGTDPHIERVRRNVDGYVEDQLVRSQPPPPDGWLLDFQKGGSP